MDPLHRLMTTKTTHSAAERDATSTVAVKGVVAGACRRELDSDLFIDERAVERLQTGARQNIRSRGPQRGSG